MWTYCLDGGLTALPANDSLSAAAIPTAALVCRYKALGNADLSIGGLLSIPPLIIEDGRMALTKWARLATALPGKGLSNALPKMARSVADGLAARFVIETESPCDSLSSLAMAIAFMALSNLTQVNKCMILLKSVIENLTNVVCICWLVLRCK